MGGDPSLQPPIFFMKPADAAVPDGGVVAYPSATADLHHEIELVTALKRGGADVAAEAALDLIFGFAAGVDLTRRDLQAEAKAQGQPWDAAKGFDQSAPIGAIRPKEDCGPLTGAITLSVNGAVKQSSRLTGMIWTVPEIISAVSRLWTLQPGDLIFTGTPDGVGPLLRGDRVHGEIEGVGCVDFTLA
jgi:fumarylpyruvate hydrolase